MMRTLIILLILVSQSYGQTIQGKQIAKPGELIVLVPLNTEETRTVWNLNYPEQFEEYAEENGKLFAAMPNTRISFSLLIIPNDITLPIRNIRHTINPNGVPDPEIDPTSPLYQVTVDSLQTVTDPDKAKWARHMQEVFHLVADKIKAGEFQTVEEMMSFVGASNRGEGFEAWPEESRQKWLVFRSNIANAFNKLEDEGQLRTIQDYWVHWKAIELGLKQ